MQLLNVVGIAIVRLTKSALVMQGSKPHRSSLMETSIRLKLNGYLKYSLVGMSGDSVALKGR